MTERLIEFEFLCGDIVWFRKHSDETNQVRSGEVVRVSLSERPGSKWHYNIEISFEEYDIFYNDGRQAKRGIHLVHSEDAKTVFKSLEELNEYEMQTNSANRR